MKNKILTGACSAVAVLALASSANATTSEGVEVSFDGGATWSVPQIVNDGGVGDFSPVAGSIVANYGFNGLTIDVVSGNVNSSGTASPLMTIVIGGQLTPSEHVDVRFSANGFTLPPSGAALVTQTANGSGYTVSETSWAGTGINGNNLFATGSTIATVGVIGPVNTGFGAGPIPGGTPNPYTITLEDDIVAASTGTGNLSVTTVLKVPDGGSTLLMLGSALSVLGFCAFRRKAVKA